MLLSKSSLQETELSIDTFNNVNIALWVEDASNLYKELCKINATYNGTLTEFLERNPHEIPRLLDLIKILDVNDYAVSLYKAPNKTVLLQGIRNYFIKESFQDFVKMILSLFSGNHEYTYTSSKITINGCKIITQVTVKIPLEARNNWSQMIVSEFEISNFIKQEVSLKIQSEKAIQETKNKEKILSIIAHDLKNPFNTILGFSDLLLSKFHSTSDDQKQEFIKYIHESAHQSYQLLSNLLTWGKMEQNSTNKNFQLFALKPLVETLHSLIQTTCINKNITIHHNIENSIEVYADLNMFSFVIRNILTNAIKFSYKNSDIYIQAYKDQKMVVIEISDQGIGMDCNTQLTLFNQDKRESRPGTDNELGTGIGLVLCKEFIEKQYGSLDIESKEGEGTKVIVKIPCEKKQYL